MKVLFSIEINDNGDDVRVLKGRKYYYIEERGNVSYGGQEPYYAISKIDEKLALSLTSTKSILNYLY